MCGIIAVSVSRQHSRRAIIKTPGSTMVKNNDLITGIMISNHIQINKVFTNKQLYTNWNKIQAKKDIKK